MFCRIYYGSISLGLLKCVAVAIYRRKVGFEEGAKLVSSNRSLEGLIDYNLEGEVSGTEDGIRKSPDDEVFVIT